MLRAAVAGTKSVSIVTIGDSEAGYPGAEGWTNGLIKWLNAIGVTMFATPIFPGGNSGAIGLGNWAGSGYVYVAPSASDEAIKSLYTQATGGDSVAQAVRAIAQPVSGTLKPNAQTRFDAAYLDANDASVQNNSKYLNLEPPMVATVGATKTFAQVSTAYTYRVRHATFASGAGQFKLLVRDTTWGGTLAESASFISTNAGAVGTAVAELAFTTRPDAANRLRMCWSYLTNSTGPFASIFESVYRPSTKGFQVTNLQYFGGATTDNVVAGVASAGQAFLKLYLQEMVETQVAAGGDGSVIVFAGGGVNGPDDAATWTEAMESLVSSVQTAWDSLGYAASKLSFLLNVSHPRANSSYAAAEAVLVETRAAAREWVSGRDGVSVIDLGQVYTGAQLLAKSYFYNSPSDEAHLTAAGYLGVVSAFGTHLLDYYENPEVGGAAPPSRSCVAFGVALDDEEWTSLAESSLVGDFNLHNSSDGEMIINTVDGASSGFVLPAGRTLRMRRVDLSRLVAHASLAGDVMSITGTFGF
jgi:hypothetical protein